MCCLNVLVPILDVGLYDVYIFSGHNIDSLLEWITSTENSLDEAPLISVDPDALDHQIKDHRVFVSEVESHKNRILSLTEKCKNQESENIEQLTDR